MHWTFSLLILYIIIISIGRGLELTQVLMHILFVLALFVCVILHELGHSLVAIKYGGEVTSITLLPIGGMANMSRMPEKPREEFLVSASGPLVNVIIAGLLWIYLAFVDPVDIAEIDFTSITTRNFPVMLLAANLFIVAFNLIPAFPMDGGRLFRSALATKMSRLRATEIAKDIGQVFAVLFIIAGLFINPFLVVIGFFILLGAKGEHEMIKYQDVLHNFTVKDLLKTDYTKLDADDTLNAAAEKLLQVSDKGFVITSDGEYSGLLTKNDLIKGLSEHGKDGKIREAMSGNVEAVATGDPLFEVYKTMLKNSYDMVPVITDKKFEGILDMETIHEFFLIRKAIN